MTFQSFNSCRPVGTSINAFRSCRMGATGIIPKYNEQGGLSYPSSYHVGGRTSQEGNDAVEHIYVINEKLVANEYLYDVVKRSEWLRAAYFSKVNENVRDTLFDACDEINKKLCDLLKLVLGKDTNNVVVCRTYHGYVWVLELDYLYDGNVYFAPIWPDIEELRSEGADTLVGNSIELFTLESDLDELARYDEEGCIPLSLDKLIDMYTDYEPAKPLEKAPAVKEFQLKFLESKEEALEAEGE